MVVMGDFNMPGNGQKHNDEYELWENNGFKSAGVSCHGNELPYTWPSGIIAPHMHKQDALHQ